MNADSELPERFYVIRRKAQGEGAPGSFGPLMQKVSDRVSALLVWDTDSAAREFLKSTLAGRGTDYEVFEADVNFCRKLRDGYRASGQQLDIVRVANDSDAGADPE